MTAPERICAPTSEPFSTTTTEVVRRKLLEPDGSGETRRPGADDDHVELHRFTGGKVRCIHGLLQYRCLLAAARGKTIDASLSCFRTLA